MKIKHHEINIPPDTPFINCKLGRESYARVLTDIVNNYADGFVLAINNEWGTGKTTFVKMWQQQLKNEGFQTIYFNAWENDFDTNPLIAIMSELESLSSYDTKKLFKSVLSKGAVLVKSVAPALLKATANKFIDIEMLTDAIENTAKGSTEILEEEIKEYSSKKKTIAEFRVELEKYIKQDSASKPLIFIIDELDRCRPTYAVEVLEQIKHFFSVSGIVFVLSIDKKHLGSAVKGFYGSEQINSEEYLRRFIDLEYSIPIPPNKLFNEYLYEYYQFNDFFSSSERKKFPDFNDDGKVLLKIADVLFTKSDITLRQQERVFALTRLILCSFNNDEFTFPHLLFILVYLKTMRNEVFQKIERNAYSMQELSNQFFDFIYSGKKNLYDTNLLYVEAMFLWFYNNNRDYRDKINLLDKEEFKKFTTEIKSKLENEYTNKSLAECLSEIARQWKFETFELSYLINKINLTESVKIK